MTRTLPQTQHSVLWVIGLFLFSLCMRVPSLLHPKAIDDEEIYSVVAAELVHGGHVYRDAIERKPPLLFYTYKAVFEVFGVHNFVALHWVAWLWVLLTMLGLFCILNTFKQRRAGLWAAGLYALYLPWLQFQNQAFNGEMIMNLPLVWAFYLVLQSSARPILHAARVFIAGALVALAALLKQPAAIALVPLLLLSFLRIMCVDNPKPSIKVWLHACIDAFLSAMGFTCVLLWMAFDLKRQGVLNEAIYWVLLDHSVPHGITDIVFWQRAISMSALFVVVCAPLMWGVLQALRHRPRVVSEGQRLSAQCWTLLLWLVVSIVGVAASGRFYSHYYIQLLPPMALLAALYYQSAVTHFSKRTRRTLYTVLALSACAFVITQGVKLYQMRHISQVAAFVRQHSRPTDRIFVWGQAPGVYTDAKRRPASRYVTTFPLTGYIFGSPRSWDPRFPTDHRIIPGAWDHLENDFAQHLPLLFIDSDAARPTHKYPPERYPYLRQLLQTRYRLTFKAKEGLIYQLTNPRAPQ